MKEVKILVLPGGEQVVGKIVDEHPAVTTTSDYIHLEDPRLIGITMQAEIQFSLYPTGIDRQKTVVLKIHRDHIITMVDPDPEFEKEYIEGTSGLIL